MTRVFIARHAETAKSAQVSHTDWPLSQEGRDQADDLAHRLQPLAPLNIVSGPALRCTETANLLSKRLGASVKIDQRIGEIVPPSGANVYGWLSQNFGLQSVVHWSELDASLNKWRDGNVQIISELKQNTVVVTHFANINAIMGAALHLKTTMSCNPSYASLTEFSVVNGDIRLVMDGTEIKGPNE